MELKINDRIRNKKVEFFDKFSVSLRYDSAASTFSFGAYFNPDNPDHKDLFCIGHYHLASLEHNGQLLVTGYILSEAFKHGTQREMASIGGYSLPGVLVDCKIPHSTYPLQHDLKTLKEIAEHLIRPFGLKMVIDPAVSAAMNIAYPKTTAKESDTVIGYLSELASQRNIIISHTAKGEVFFTKAKTRQTPILNYGGDGLPCPEMSLSFNGQAMHSHILVMKQADSDGGNAGETEIRNPYVPYVYRPEVVVQNSGDDIDTEQAAKNKLAEELKNLKVTVTTDRWEINGKIILPNNLITVINPDIYLFKRTTLFIEQVDLVGDNKSTTATLHCVLPEVYSGETPKYIFSGINTH